MVTTEGLSYLESLKSYVGFSAESSALLLRLRPLVEPHFQTIIDDFYDTIEAHPGARAVITEGNAQIQRLKQTLVRWLEELLTGPHDEAYFERRARIGRMHVRINLPQGFMFTAMDRIRVQLLDRLQDVFKNDPEAGRATSRALHQILDIELAIMLETYREDLISKMRNTERLSTIGQFAAGIGHELRNPLGVIESSQFLLRNHLDRLSVQDPAVTRHLDKIATEVQRSNKTINDLLELARNRPAQRKPIPATQLIDTALPASLLPGSVEIKRSLPADLVLHGDLDQLGRLFVNLFTNASQAMGGSGTIWVEGWREGSTVFLRVRDSGPGVPAEVRHRIFEALFTTKAKGSGLGLALARQVVEAHGGTLALETGAGGASFLLAIPDTSPAGGGP